MKVRICFQSLPVELPFDLPPERFWSEIRSHLRDELERAEACNQIPNFLYGADGDAEFLQYLEFHSSDSYPFPS